VGVSLSAAACWWVPLALMLVTIAIADLTSSPQLLRLLFVAFATAMLVFGFYLVYSRRPVHGADNPARGLWRLNAAMMWIAAVGVAVFTITAGPGPSGRKAPVLKAGPAPVELARAQRFTMTVKGMVCQGCVETITEALLAVPGVLDADVDLEGARAVVSLAPDRTPADSALVNTVIRAGYNAWPVREGKETAIVEDEDNT
jgi:copper chaperone CopZ